MPPIEPPRPSRPSRGPLPSALQLVRALLLDRRYFFHLTVLLALGELVLGLLIIHKVPCTRRLSSSVVLCESSESDRM